MTPYWPNDTTSEELLADPSGDHIMYTCDNCGPQYAICVQDALENCPNCGIGMPVDDDFCSACGERIPEKEPEEFDDDSAEHSDPDDSIPLMPAGKIVILLILLAIAFGIYDLLLG